MRLAAGALAVALLAAGCARPADDPWVPTPPQALLWDMFFQEILVEVDHAPGRELPRAALDGAIAELRTLTKREVRLGSVREIAGHDPDPSREWSLDELLALSHATRDDPASAEGYGSGRSAILHVLALDGTVRTDRPLLGYALENVAAVFPDEHARIQPLGRAHPSFALDVQQTLTHEMGHTVGLVGCGVPMVRPRSDGGCHSTSEESVMYAWHDRLGSTLELVQPGSQPLRFDADDRADIAAYLELGKRCAVDPGCGAPRGTTGL